MKTSVLVLIVLVGCAVVAFLIIYFLRKRSENMSRRLLAGFLCFMGQKYHQAHWDVVHTGAIPAANQAREIVHRMGECRIRVELALFIESTPIFIDSYRYPHLYESTRKFLEKLHPLLAQAHRDHKSGKKTTDEVVDSFCDKLGDIVSESI
jgi:hypothetical protein